MDIISPPKLNIILDASKIDLFETCPQRYNFRYNHNKVQGANKTEALDKGSLVHEGFGVYFTELSKETKYDDRMQLSLNKIREISSNPDQSNLDPDDVEVLLKAFEESCDFWRSEDENCLTILAVEQPFANLLYEDDIVRLILSGKIDLLTNFRGLGRNASYQNLPFDHKTFSRDSPIHRKSNQFINYCNAVESNYLIVNRVGLQKSLKAEEKYKRIPLSYDPIYIQDWKDNLTKMLLNEFMTCAAENYWPEKPTSCNKFNRLCEYYSICDSSGHEAKNIKLEQNYVYSEVWDVTAGLNQGD